MKLWKCYEYFDIVISNLSIMITLIFHKPESEALHIPITYMKIESMSGTYIHKGSPISTVLSLRNWLETIEWIKITHQSVARFCTTSLSLIPVSFDHFVQSHRYFTENNCHPIYHWSINFSCYRNFSKWLIQGSLIARTLANTSRTFFNTFNIRNMLAKVVNANKIWVSHF